MRRPRIQPRDVTAISRAIWARGWNHNVPTPEQHWPQSQQTPRIQWSDKEAAPQNTQETDTMPPEDVPRLLAELENVLATAEELRYRIKCELSSNPGQAQPQPQAQRQAQPAPRNTQPTKAASKLDTTTLTRTGGGLWAWAKEFGYTRQVTDLGKAAGFPPRTVDWTGDQIDQVVDALEQLLDGAESPQAAHATVRSQRPRRNGKPY